jgi:hypothetical protein
MVWLRRSPKLVQHGEEVAVSEPAQLEVTELAPDRQ